MSLSEQTAVTRQALQKMKAAVSLVQASLNKLKPYNDHHTYSADEREPYDALSDRFIRAVEVSIKYFRSYERLQFAENSDTLRDLLNRMEKLGLITSVELWFRMRDVRNRIVHDYLPQDVKNMYDDVIGPFGRELTCSLETAITLQSE